MKLFTFEAYTADGKRKTGTLSALNERAVIDALTQDGLFPASVTADDTTEQSQTQASTGVGRRPLVLEEQSLFFRQLAVMLHSALPLEMALRSLADSEGSPRFKQLAARLAHGVQDGRTLSSMLEGGSTGFPSYVPAVVEAGETSGKLQDVFTQLADHLGEVERQKAGLWQALLYPMFVGSVAIAVALVLVVTIAPEMQAMLAGANVQMPPLTATVVAFGDSLTRNWMIYLAVLAGLCIGLIVLARHEAGRALLDRIAAHIPVFARLRRLDRAARYLRTLALILQSKQTVVVATKGATNVLSLARHKTVAQQVTRAVIEGEALSNALRRLPFLPPLVLQMIKVGEDTAEVDKMAARAADVIETWLGTERKRIATLLEPLLLVLVGGVVLLVALSVLLPIFDIQSAVQY